jgi:hypothetical protein
MSKYTKNTKAHLMDEEYLEIENKVKQATALLKEANALALKKNCTLRDPPITSDGEELISTWELISEIGKGGWRTSSLSC